MTQLQEYIASDKNLFQGKNIACYDWTAGVVMHTKIKETNVQETQMSNMHYPAFSCTYVQQPATASGRTCCTAGSACWGPCAPIRAASKHEQICRSMHTVCKKTWPLHALSSSVPSSPVCESISWHTCRT